MTMNNSSKWLGGDVCIFAMALGLAACSRLTAPEAGIALQIQQVQVLSGGDCTVPGEATSLHRSAGVLDLALPDGSAPPYYLPVAVINNLAATGDTPANEMNNITFTHFTVELSAPNVVWSDSCPATFDTPSFTFVLAPGASTGQGFNAITSSHSRCIQPYVPAEGLAIKAKIRAVGWHGGNSIESAPFVYEVTACNGCLQQGYTDPALIAYEYPYDYPLCAALTGNNPYMGDPCLPPGQDELILCCGATVTINGTPQNAAICPGLFTGSTSTGTSTSTAH
ncbi:MAG: hypothetical protein JXP73_15370 [Deltaproteobacteria bacterium]|jgi:hypothetical protein|nr:hypothetical protein [Deltaproteobacteria bacterium]